MTTIPSSAFDAIVEELKRQPLPMNMYRRQAGEGRSQAFGVVGRRCMPPDYSRLCWMRPYLYKLLLDFGSQYVPFSFNAITINQNYQAAKHRDKHNKGNSFLIGFGDYTGGELEILEGELKGVYTIKNTPIVADFSKIYHQVLPFQGDRYSLVYYTYTSPRLTDLPPPSVIEKNGKYIFKRGDEEIYHGLPHPLKGRKRNAVGTILVERGNHSVEFS